jgi:hypothetical protein
MRGISLSQSAFCRPFNISTIEVKGLGRDWLCRLGFVGINNLEIRPLYPQFTTTQKISLRNSLRNVLHTIAHCQVKGASDPLAGCCWRPTRSCTSLVQTRRVSEDHER